MTQQSRAAGAERDQSLGGSAVAWETADGGHLWGRNFDFNRIAADSKVTFVPRGQVFYACGTELRAIWIRPPAVRRPTLRWASAPWCCVPPRPQARPPTRRG